MLHTFVALVEDKPGVLTRVASLFRRLNINIVSLTVGRSERVGVSRMTIVCEARRPPGAASRRVSINWKMCSRSMTSGSCRTWRASWR